jgi:hypothetical protein
MMTPIALVKGQKRRRHKQTGKHEMDVFMPGNQQSTQRQQKQSYWKQKTMHQTNAREPYP